MENTLKGAGVDVAGARTHFDDLEKANLGSTPESIGDGADYFAGQVKGRAQEGGNPSTGAVGKVNSGKKVKKSDFLVPQNVSAADVEAAYEVYKAAATEQQFKDSLNNVFADRLSKEQSQAREARAHAQFDARGPLAEIQKAIQGIESRIENLSAAPAEGAPLMKSDLMATVEIPSSEQLATMDWEDVHALANKVWE
jgi:hypothetical protein